MKKSFILHFENFKVSQDHNDTCASNSVVFMDMVHTFFQRTSDQKQPKTETNNKIFMVELEMKN